MGEQGENRKVLKCKLCGLVQFEIQGRSDCRRCRRPLSDPPAQPKPEAEPEPTPEAAPEGWSRLGENIRKIREARGMSQRDLARKLNRPRTWISRIERGPTVPRVRSILLMAKALRVEPVTFFEGISSPAIPATEWDMELMKALPHLSPANRQILLDAASGMLDGQYTFKDWMSV